MKVCILGTGAYGIALGLILKENNHEVKMWTKFEEEANYLNQTRVSPNLKNIPIDQEILITTNFEQCITDTNLIIVAVPVGVVDSVAQNLKNYITDNQHICIASKGIEKDSCLFVSDIIKKYIDSDKIGVISGPTFAIDVAHKVPIGLSLASTNQETINIIKEALQNNHVKLRESKDITGVEICGSIKNVIAIASGILNGMGLPISTQAMLITESLNDIKNLIEDLGGNKNTILSYAGFGDILLTCTSTKSRNFSFGQLIGSKTSKEEINNYIKTTTIEGLYTLDSIYKLINSKGIDMPIINLIYDIIYNEKSVEELISFLIKK